MGLSPNQAMFMSAAGMAGQTLGAYKSAKGQKAALQYQAAIDENNAKLAEEQAGAALAAGAREEQALRMKIAATMADQKAVAAANGVDVTTGSPLELRAATAILGDNDALTIRDNAARQAWAYGEQARGYRDSASMNRRAAKSVSPFMAAGTSLLTSAGAISDKWYRYRDATTGKGR